MAKTGFVPANFDQHFFEADIVRVKLVPFQSIGSWFSPADMARMLERHLAWLRPGSFDAIHLIWFDRGGR
ncbi:hypothetical protein CGZ80_09210 [Rhodopirellula sp. MGV]|nr:hypothetical protein CGZ80_09210 [Rhodopirellula sp. MGV]PNY34886.1 hypothetical protein C2E31_21065 [Rhodopirellula baltica]